MFLMVEVHQPLSSNQSTYYSGFAHTTSVTFLIGSASPLSICPLSMRGVLGEAHVNLRFADGEQALGYQSSTILL